MLKMGKMCHCKATLWKVRRSDGKIIWRADRLPLYGSARSLSVDLYDDGTDVWLYESGGFLSGDPAGSNVTKWKDAGDSAEREWNAVADDDLGRASDAAINDISRAILAADGYVWWLPDFRSSTSTKDAWLFNDTNGSRFSSGNLTTTGRAELGQQTPIWKAPSSGIYTATRIVSGIFAAFGAIQKVDNAFVDVATTQTTGADISYDFAPLNGDSTTGFVVWRRANAVLGTPAMFVRMDSGLARVFTLASAGPPVVRNSSRNGKFLAADATTLDRRDNTTLALDWTVAVTPQGTATLPVVACLDDSGNAYVSCTPASIEKITAGAVVWTYTFTNPALFLARDVIGMYADEAAGTLVVYGGPMTIGGEVVQMFGLSLVDGSLQWKTNLGSVSTSIGLKDGVVNGDYIYVCGNKM